MKAISYIRVLTHTLSTKILERERVTENVTVTQQKHEKHFTKCQPLSTLRNTCTPSISQVLLTLTRSNQIGPKGKIGFLKESNRVCVGLSRARHGMYVIGNLTMMQGKSKYMICIHVHLLLFNASINPAVNHWILSFQCMAYLGINSVVLPCLALHCIVSYCVTSSQRPIHYGRLFAVKLNLGGVCLTTSPYSAISTRATVWY